MKHFNHPTAHPAAPFQFYRWQLGLLLFLVLLWAPATAQRIAPIGEWTDYMSHRQPHKIVKAGERFAIITDGGLYLMDSLGQDMDAYTPLQGLHDVAPTALYYDSLHHLIFVGYSSGAINYTADPARGFKYISDIERSEQYTTKGIREFTSYGDLVYVSTEFGIVIYDIVKQETRSAVTKIGTSPTGSPVGDLLILQDSLYAVVGDHGLWRAPLNHPNITLPDAWEKVSGSNGMADGKADFIAHAAGWFYAVVEDTVFQKADGTHHWAPGPYPVDNFHEVDATGDYFFMAYSNVLRVRPPSSVQYLFSSSSLVTTAYVDSNLVLAGDKSEGIYRFRQPDSIYYLVPQGPSNNKVSELAVGNGTLVIAPEGKVGLSAAANNRDGFYTFNMDEGWKVYNFRKELKVSDSLYMDFARTIYHPETDRFYLGSWQHGVLELTGGKITHQWTPRNSNLSGSLNIGQPRQIRVSGLAVDRNGVLFATGMLADYNLCALDPVDSTWHRMSLPSTGPIGMIVDDWNNKWIINQDNGIVVFNENGTLNTTADDQFKAINTDAGNGRLPNNSVYALAKDQRGHIWVGTIEGIVVFANPGAVFSNNFADASCPVIDGFCLLRDQRVTSIAVDGANRKWIGTTNGVYLVNPQGNKLLHHYTKENSPLIENEIRDIVIDPKTGEVFIGTTRGLISLMGDATEGKENSDSLYVFPNPIPFDFDGPIAINGSVKDAEVHISTVSGRLVRSLISTGGQTVWDGRDMAGNRLVPGVYLAMVAAKDGSGGGIAKFVILSGNP